MRCPSSRPFSWPGPGSTQVTRAPVDNGSCVALTVFFLKRPLLIPLRGSPGPPPDSSLPSHLAVCRRALSSIADTRRDPASARRRRAGLSLCLHALSSFQRTNSGGRSKIRLAQTIATPPIEPLGPLLGEPYKITSVENQLSTERRFSPRTRGQIVAQSSGARTFTGSCR